MILLGDVSPAVGASLVALGIAAVVNPTVALFLQSRQFRNDGRRRDEERAHDRERWEQEKEAQRDLAQAGRRMEARRSSRDRTRTLSSKVANSHKGAVARCR